MLPVEISFLSPISLHIMHNVTPLIYNLEIERAIRRLDPYLSKNPDTEDQALVTPGGDFSESQWN